MPAAIPLVHVLGRAGQALRTLFVRQQGLPECCPAPAPPPPAGWRRWLALAAMRRALAADRARHDTPWVALLGERGAGKSSLAASVGAQWRTQGTPLPAIAGGAALAWHRYEMGTLVDVDGALSASGWKAALRTLARLRPERPLHGVLLAVSAATLAGPAASLQACALAVRRQLDDVQRRYGFTLPVYLVVTRADALPGYAAFWAALPQVARSEMVGWACPALPDGGTARQWAAEAMDTVGARLRALQVRAAAGAGPIADPDAFFLFPRHLGALEAPLGAWMEVALQPSCQPGGYLLRGIWFTGATGANEVPVARSDVRFVDDLVLHKALAERHLAQPARRRILARGRRLRLVQLGLAAALTAALAWTVHASLALTDRASRMPQELQVLLAAAALPQPERCLGPARAHELLRQVDRFDPAPRYLPWSWLDRRAQVRASAQLARGVLDGALLPALQCRLEDRARALLAQAPDGAGGERSEQALFAWLDRLLAFERDLERLRRIDAAAADPHGAAVAMLALARTEWGAGPAAPAAGASAAPGAWRVAMTDTLARAGVPAAWLEAAPAPPAAPERGLVLAMAEVRYRSPGRDGWLPHTGLERRMRQLTLDLEAGLRRELGNGGALLDTLARQAHADGAPAPGLADEVRRAAAWLAWVSDTWLPSSEQDNPCRAAADGLMRRQAALAAHGYALDPSGFSPERCYAGAMRTLRAQQVPGYGSVVSLADGAAQPVLNPGLARERDGLAALLRTDFMQAPAAAPFSCAVAADWDAGALRGAAAQASAHAAFAAAHPAPAGQPEPLFRQIALRQLCMAMDGAVDLAQARPEYGAGAFDGDDARMSARSARFDAAAGELATVVGLYRQHGFSGGASALNACVRDQASAVLGEIGALAQRSRLYAPAENGAGDALFDLGSPSDIEQFLARQIDRVKVLAGYAKPYARYLLESGTVADQHKTPAQLDPYWNNTIRELNQYVLGNDSSGQAGKLHALFTKVLPALDTDNCGKDTAGPLPDGGADLFSQHRRQAAELAAARCGKVGDARLLGDYLALAAQFDESLAGRFPFGGLSARDLPPDVAQRFFREHGAALAALRSRTAQRGEERWRARRAFLDQLDQARTLFDSLAGPLRLTLSFNRRPGSAAYADQILNWTFSSAAQSVGWPNRPAPLVAWSSGQALALDLQWADRSPWHPLPDRGQSDLAIDGETASFAWGGDWALLRMLARHRPLDGPDDGILEFRVPIGPAAGGRGGSQARVYLGLSLSATDARTQAETPVSVPARFPHSSPR